MTNATAPARRATHIKVCGTEHRILASFSSGPGTPTHTYQIAAGWVSNRGGAWAIQRHGQMALACTVESVPPRRTVYR